MRIKFLLFIVPLLLLSCHKHEELIIDTEEEYYYCQTYSFHSNADKPEHLYWFLNDEFISKGKECTVRFTNHGDHVLKAAYDARMRKVKHEKNVHINVLHLGKSFGQKAEGDMVHSSNPVFTNLEVRFTEGQDPVGNQPSFDYVSFDLTGANDTIWSIFATAREPGKATFTSGKANGKSFYGIGDIIRNGKIIHVKVEGESYDNVTKETTILSLDQNFILP